MEKVNKLSIRILLFSVLPIYALYSVIKYLFIVEQSDYYKVVTWLGMFCIFVFALYCDYKSNNLGK